MNPAIINKVAATIESCVTYDQVESCVSFLKNRNVCNSNYDKEYIGFLLKDKLRKMHTVDLKFHNSEMLKLIEERNNLLFKN